MQMKIDGQDLEINLLKCALNDTVSRLTKLEEVMNSPTELINETRRKSVSSVERKISKTIQNGHILNNTQDLKNHKTWQDEKAPPKNIEKVIVQ